jgi:hypothetical protein
MLLQIAGPGRTVVGVAASESPGYASVLDASPGQVSGAGAALEAAAHVEHSPDSPVSFEPHVVQACGGLCMLVNAELGDEEEYSRSSER